MLFDMLTFQTFGVTKHIEVSIQTQDKILESQQGSLKVQSNMVKDNNAPYQTVDKFSQFRYSWCHFSAIYPCTLIFLLIILQDEIGIGYGTSGG